MFEAKELLLLLLPGLKFFEVLVHLNVESVLVYTCLELSLGP